MEDKKEFLTDEPIEEIKGNAILRWLEQTVRIIDKYGIIKLIQAGLVALIAVVIVMSLSNPDKIFRMYEDFRNNAHNELIAERTRNTPKIQDACDELLLRSGADRVVFLELHNNTGNLSGMPFFYASASCESLDEGIRPVADQYLEIKLSLFPFSTYLFQNRYWCGNMDDMLKIDKSLYYRMMSNEAHHTAFLLVEGVDQVCGVIMLTYQENEEKEETHDCKRVRCEMERTARKIAFLVEAPKYD